MRYLSILILSLFSLAATAQTANFHDMQAAFEQYCQEKGIENGKYLEDGELKKAFGWKKIKRWEWFWEQRVGESGEFPKHDVVWEEWEKQQKAARTSANNQTAPWTFCGPSTSPGGYNGLGRINCMAFHPTDANTFWVGSPSGGLWKTTDGGNSWVNNNDDLPVLGVSDIAINPNNPDVMYIATGDGEYTYSLSALGNYESGASKSVGVLKSTDGGMSWNTTSLSWSQSNTNYIRRLVINPSNPQILYLASSNGIWKSTDAGQNWSLSRTGYFIDLELKPGSPNTIYASSFNWNGARIFRSTDAGGSWNQVGNFNNSVRLNIEVCAASPNFVDVVGANDNGGLEGLWNSTDGGATFNQYYTGTGSNNMLHNDPNMQGVDGQGLYDLAYAVNPNNSNVRWLGGVNTWNTTDGGNNWNIESVWSQGFVSGVPVVHADKHFFTYHPLQPNTFFDCNDGGIYKTTNGGNTWTDLSNGLGIGQLYRIGVSQSTTNKVLCGHQDNGTKELDGNNWHERKGGDGMECIIHPTNSNTAYASIQNGDIFITTNNWSSNTEISDNIPGNPDGPWVTPYVMDPSNPNTLYAGYKELYKTTNQGTSWTSISPFISGDYIRSIAVAPSDPQYIYIASYDSLYYTTDGGSNWSNNPINFTSENISYIAVNPNNPTELWITISGYQNGNKVFRSNDGGANFTNVSGSLPNLPANCITYELGGPNDGLYVGTDLGVYYKDNTMSDWIPFMTDLPNVIVTEIEVSEQDELIYAATYGRGLWKAEMYYVSALIADFSISKNPICKGECIDFFDATSDVPIAWYWSFPGATPSSSTDQNPTNICYDTPGTYTVSLTAFSSSTDATKSLADHIVVEPCLSVEETSNNSLLLFPNPNDGRFQLEAGQENIGYLEVVNALGETVWEQSEIAKESVQTIDLRKLPSGVYFLKAYLLDKQEVHQLMIQH